MNILNASIRKTNVRVVFSLLFMFLMTSIASAQVTYAQKMKIGEEGARPSGIIGTSDGGNALLFSGVIVRKIDASGKKVWQRDLGLESPTFSYYFIGRGITELSDGGYIVTGSKSLSIGYPIGVEAWLIKLTKAGRVEWQKRFIENRFSVALSSVVSSSDGGFFAAGQRGPDPVYSGNSGNGGVIVASFDSSGGMRWGKVFGDDFRYNVYFFPKLLVTSGQELIVLSQLLSSQTGEDLGTLVLKLDADGNLLWKKLLKKESEQFISGAVTADGGCILLSSDHSIRLSSSGAILWKKRFRVDSKKSVGLAVTQSANGDFTIAGFVGISSEIRGFLAKLNSSGKVVSSVFYDKTTSGAVGFPKFILPASDSGHVVFGETVFGSDKDAFLLKLNSNANLPGCNRFSAVAIERQKFGALETSSPDITTKDWIPQNRSLDISSKRITSTSSSFCP